MHKTLGEIAKFINGELVGDGDVVITGIKGIKEAEDGDISFIANRKYFPLLQTTKASAVIIPRDVIPTDRPVIKTDNPSLAFAAATSLFIDDRVYHIKGIHPTAIVAKDAVIGKNVNIGAYVVIEAKAQIGDRTTIYPGCFVGHHTIMGEDCLIYANTTIRERIIIGNHVIIHSGTVIGSDGFGYVDVEGVHQKIPQIGTVVIEDNVEIGSCVTIDRARFEKTLIGRGTKIDNLVQVAHNVIIGENCIIVSQTGISGSSVLGKNVVLAGQVGLAGHLTIGDNSIVASKSGVPKSIPPNSVVFGYPAKPHAHAMRVNACIQRLPHYVKTINDLSKRIEELETQLIQLKKPARGGSASGGKK